MERRTAGVLLAAGGSVRLGTPKQLLKVNGVTLVERAARQLLEAGCEPVIVVVGSSADEIRDAVALLPVSCAENLEWMDGMGGSIAMAIAKLNGVIHDARDESAPNSVLIATCDMPSVTVEHLSSLLEAASSGSRVASEYIGADGARVRGIPAVLPHADFGALEALSGDQGARSLLRNAQTLTVFLRQGNFDLDTPEDVAAWRASGAE